MALRQIKMPTKNDQAEQEAEEVFSQSKRPERGRYLLQTPGATPCPPGGRRPYQVPSFVPAKPPVPGRAAISANA
jgi:hypothetical protein